MKTFVIIITCNNDKYAVVVKDVQDEDFAISKALTWYRHNVRKSVAHIEVLTLNDYI